MGRAIAVTSAVQNQLCQSEAVDALIRHSAGLTRAVAIRNNAPTKARSRIMKFTALTLCLVPALIILSSGPAAEAVSSEKALKKAAYAPYTGQQRDWPRSDEHVAPTEIGRGGVPIYD